MSIAPIVSTVSVKAPPERAFKLFSQHISEWWQGRGKCAIAEKPWVAIVLESKTGGRLFERDADGKESEWGSVLAYEAPQRLLIAWNLNSSWKYDPNFVTEVEVTFTANKTGGTDVRLEHRNLEKFGVDAEKMSSSLGGGWPTHLNGFGAFADQHKD